MNDKSFELFSKEHAASEKFDYFICSIAGALFAYIGQTYAPHTFDCWYYYLMPGALLLLTVSFLFGLWLIKVSKDITKLNQTYVSYHEANQQIQIQLHEVDKATGKPLERFMSQLGEFASRQDLIAMMMQNTERIKKASKQSSQKARFADKLELTRNISLAIGFALILFSK